MAGDFENVGVALKAKSGRSLRLELNNMPGTLFNNIVYLSVKDAVEIIEGRKKRAALYMRKPKQRNQSCEVHTS